MTKEGWWSPSELEILKATYPQEGFAACVRLLPNRTKGAIDSKIRALRLSRKPAPRLSIPKDAERFDSTGLMHLIAERIGARSRATA